MKISESWLRTWVNPAVDSATLADQLTMLGLEVDEIAPVAKPFTGVVVGEVLTVEQHPDADRLRVTTVNVGTDEPLQIVCGAPNVRVGMRVPVAMVGAVLLSGDLKIKKGKLRGVASHGMLCGASEIGLEDKIDGLLDLPADAPIGTDIREYLNLDDQVIDISITPNRGDCFSIRGIAREVGVINQIKVDAPLIKEVPATITEQKQVTLATDGAPRYLGRVIKNVNVQAQTPEWMENALIRSGIRAHSFLVDVTNYVLLELGQPMHAFDLAKVSGDITVRQAKPQEKLQLLNEQEVELSDDIMVIADDQKALAIAGIMGGLESSVTNDTHDIFLESAFFAPLAIAGRARRFGLHTDSSQRFERGVDFELPMMAMNRASVLIQEIAGGEFGEITVAEKADLLPKREPIVLKQAQVNALLGYEVASDFITDALTRLGCNVTVNADEWSVVPPSHRYDMVIYQDLIEEVARIHGYDNIQTRLPVMDIQLAKYEDGFELPQLRQTIATLGYQEAISFSFADAKLEKQLNPNVKPLMLANPISSDLAAMRSTLLSSLIPCVQYNLNRQQNRVRFFELGLRFDYQNADNIDGLKQTPTLALIAVGSRTPEQWHSKPQPMDFFDFKGEVEEILAAGRVNVEYVRSEREWLHPGQSAEILMNGLSIGYLGRLHPSLEESLDLGITWVAELDQERVLQSYVSNFTELSRFPSVRRDIALLIDDKISVKEIQQLIQETSGDLLDSTWLFDVYTGQGVENGKRSLAFAMLWQHPSRTLEDAEIKSGMDHIIEVLQNTYQATLRAS